MRPSLCIYNCLFVLRCRVIGSSPMMPQTMQVGHQHITILPGGRAIQNHSDLSTTDDLHKTGQMEDTSADYYSSTIHNHSSATSELSLDPSLSEIAIQVL